MRTFYFKKTFYWVLSVTSSFESSPTPTIVRVDERWNKIQQLVRCIIHTDFLCAYRARDNVLWIVIDDSSSSINEQLNQENHKTKTNKNNLCTQLQMVTLSFVLSNHSWHSLCVVVVVAFRRARWCSCLENKRDFF